MKSLGQDTYAVDEVHFKFEGLSVTCGRLRSRQEVSSRESSEPVVHESILSVRLEAVDGVRAESGGGLDDPRSEIGCGGGDGGAPGPDDGHAHRAAWTIHLVCSELRGSGRSVVMGCKQVVL